jgi:hypothetical protein
MGVFPVCVRSSLSGERTRLACLSRRLAATNFNLGQRGELSGLASFSGGYADNGDLTDVDVDAGTRERCSRKRFATVAASSAIMMTITARCSALVRTKMFFIRLR